jgi:hypothetical protein
MAKVISRTVTTQISGDRKIKPQSVLWMLVNDGQTNLFVDGTIRKPGEHYGIDSSQVAHPSLNAGTTFENDTEFQIRFDSSDPAKINSARLVETVYSIEGVQQAAPQQQRVFIPAAMPVKKKADNTGLWILGALAAAALLSDSGTNKRKK